MARGLAWAGSHSQPAWRRGSEEKRGSNQIKNVHSQIGEGEGFRIESLIEFPPLNNDIHVLEKEEFLFSFIDEKEEDKEENFIFEEGRYSEKEAQEEISRKEDEKITQEELDGKEDKIVKTLINDFYKEDYFNFNFFN